MERAGRTLIHIKKLRYISDSSTPSRKDKAAEFPRRLRWQGRGAAFMVRAAKGVARRLAVGLQSLLSRASHAAACRGRGGIAKVRFFQVIAAVRAQGRLCQLSARSGLYRGRIAS
jgi:hypothetical protein